MYHQRRELGPDEKTWPHRILGGRRVLHVEENGDAFRIKVCLSSGEEIQDGPLLEEETLDVDLIITATGYSRTAHVDMLKEAWPLLPNTQDQTNQLPKRAKDRWLVETSTPGHESDQVTKETRVLEVGRDYGVRFSPDAVAPGSGIWLQGCCEGTHGVSEPLIPALSYLIKRLTLAS